MPPLHKAGSSFRQLTTSRRVFYSHFNSGNKKPGDPRSINVSKDEYSKSGGDDVVAAQESSYNEKLTDPTSHLEAAKKGNTINPLEVSPANPDTSIHIEEKEWRTDGAAAKA